MVWYSHLFQNFPQFIVIYTVKSFGIVNKAEIGVSRPCRYDLNQIPYDYTVKGFGIVNKAEIDVFPELSCFFNDPADVGNWISGSSAFSKTSLNIWKFMVHVLLKPGLENFEHYFTTVWSECNCEVV